MKSLLLWLITVLALVVAALFYVANQSKTEELAKLRPQLQTLEGLRKENTELKASQLSAEELDRMRKNTEELLRLRNEVRQLRETEKQLTKQVQTAQSAAERAQEQAVAARTQAQTAQTQMQAQMQALTAPTNVVQSLTPEQRVFAERYGLAPTAAGQQANACINNLRQLDGAKQQWALENRKPANATPSTEEVQVYLKEFPKCPSGGVYSINTVETHPTCSTPGHTLAK